MQATIRKFQIGFLVIGVLVGGLFIWYVANSLTTRQDIKVQKAAVDIADKLNNYITNNQQIPASLSEADINDVPSQIRYDKLSDKKYKFCIIYKGSNKEPETIESAKVIGSLYFGSPVGNGGFGNYTSNETLYIPANHKKGEVCQTIEPYIYTIPDYHTDTNSNFDGLNSDYYQYN